MGKKRVVLADKDSNLMKTLLVKLLSEQNSFYDVELITDPAYLQVYFEQLRDMDVLVIGEEMLSSISKPDYTACSVILLSDEQKESGRTSGGYQIFYRKGEFNKLFYALLKSAESQSEDGTLSYERPNDIDESRTELSRHIVLLTDTGIMESMVISGKEEGIFYFSEEAVAERKFYIYMSRLTTILVYADGVDVSGSRDVRENCIELGKNRFLKIRCGDRHYTLYTEFQRESDLLFHNYRIEDNSRVYIGKESFNAIFYDNPFISKQHAVLEYREGVFYIRDLNSTNGTYVNGKRTSEAALLLGDKIYLMGLQIIIGNGYLAINNFHKGVYLNSDMLSQVRDSEELSERQEEIDRTFYLEQFNREPRKRRYIPGDKIEIDAPPMAMTNNNIPLILRMGGSAVTGMTSALAGNYVLLLSSLLFPFLNHRFTDKQKEEYENKRKEYYSSYLEKKQEEINQEIQAEQTALRANYPETKILLKQVLEGKNLWERRVTDDDFLLLRVGSGTLPLRARITSPRERMNLQEDPLEKRMRDIAEFTYSLKDVPMQLSLKEDYVIGITGQSVERLSFMETIILNVVLLHSYDEVKTVFLLDEKHLEQMNYLRFLPHVWDKQKNLRYIASSPAESVRIGEALRNELSQDLERRTELSVILKKRPYYIIFAFDQKQYENLEIIKEILLEDRNLGVSVVSACRNLPKECSKIIHVEHKGENRIIQIRDIDKKDIPFARDDYPAGLAFKALRKVSNIFVQNEDTAYTLPKMMTFLELFGVGRVEYLNPLKRWSNSSPEKTLAAPVGVGTDGEVFTLDLHEKAQGPHGLVAGMTGSGKSEFIITYILSMAVNYHPDEVAFVLIDYKGGGLAGAFDDPERGIHLPHLVGTITNLDGAGIRRSLISLQSELLRRQRVFNEAKTIANEGTMDIYDYQRLYRKGILNEPMPHLFIISDEFAELKAQKPEFMDQLISIARIGRSLGVHLILATQKPSGVVNAQILSNTRFRVCLKVQDRADSQDMLQRPDAAELKDTGRFYLQVGYNEYFALGQSAWSGAPYAARDDVVVKKDESLQVLDLTGQVVASAQPEQKAELEESSQLVSVVTYLSELAEREGVARKNLWLPALEPVIRFEQLQSAYDRSDPYHIPLGMIDDPENQKQYLWKPDLMSCRNMWIAGLMETGKTSLLESILLSASDHLSPEDIQYYILTYSGKQFGLFRELPHCGAVLGEEDMDELERFFRLLDDIIKERKELYKKKEFSSFASCRQEMRLPMILIVIDNIKMLKDSDRGMKYYDMLADYLKAGPLYGLQFVITSTLLSDVMGRMKTEIGDRVAYKLRDRFDVGELLGVKVESMETDNPGRGTLVYDGRPLVFQSIIFCPELDGKDRMDALRAYIHELAGKYQGGMTARKFDQIDEEEEFRDFMRRFPERRLPVGYSLMTARPAALPYKQFSMLKVYYGNPDSRLPLTSNYIQWAESAGMDLMLIERKEDSLFDQKPDILSAIEADKERTYIRLTSSKEDIDRSWDLLTQEILRRKEILMDYCAKKGLDYKDKNIAGHSFNYMSTHTRPYLLFIERFYDYCMEMTKEAGEVMTTILSLLRQYNMYLIGCFYPGDADHLNSNMLMRAFNKEDLILLYGGDLNSQGLTRLPAEYTRSQGGFGYNRGLMKYRDSFYPILTPCGAWTEADEEEDDRDIFA